MEDEAIGRGLFIYMYYGANLIRMVADGRSDPDNVKGIIDEAAAEAKRLFPQHAASIDRAGRGFDEAVAKGEKFRRERGDRV